jgi:hypothetical protein
MKTNVNIGRPDPNCDIPERRLWLAVLTQAVEDWRSANLRQQRAAQDFLFASQKDFTTVCSSAGINPGSLGPKLLRMKPAVEQSSVPLEANQCP